MSDKRRMYYVGFCRICGTGPLGLRECGGCGEVVVLCDECDAVLAQWRFLDQTSICERRRIALSPLPDVADRKTVALGLQKND